MYTLVIVWVMYTTHGVATGNTIIPGFTDRKLCDTAIQQLTNSKEGMGIMYSSEVLSKACVWVQ